MDLSNFTSGITLDLIIKFAASATTFLIAFKNLQRYFSNHRKRVLLKTDLELLKLFTDNNLDSNLIRSRIKRVEKDVYADKRNYWFASIIEVLVGLFLFVGFGLWSLKIYTSNNGFSPWLILTTFISVLGLSMLFQENENDKAKEKNRKAVFSLEIYSWRKLVTAVSIIVLFVTLTVVIFILYGLSFWHILTILLVIAGFSQLADEIKLTFQEKTNKAIAENHETTL